MYLEAWTGTNPNPATSAPPAGPACAGWHLKTWSMSRWKYWTVCLMCTKLRLDNDHWQLQHRRHRWKQCCHLSFLCYLRQECHRQYWQSSTISSFCLCGEDREVKFLVGNAGINLFDWIKGLQSKQLTNLGGFLLLKGERIAVIIPVIFLKNLPQSLRVD